MFATAAPEELAAAAALEAEAEPLALEPPEAEDAVALPEGAALEALLLLPEEPVDERSDAFFIPHTTDWQAV